MTRASTEIIAVETEREGHVLAKARRYNLQDFMPSECGEGRVESKAANAAQLPS